LRRRISCGANLAAANAGAAIIHKSPEWLAVAAAIPGATIARAVAGTCAGAQPLAIAAMG
jgi:hypothetical protein